MDRWCFIINSVSLHIELVFQDSDVSDSLYNEKNLLYSLANLFAAGTDTTASTLRWGLLLMAKYPRIQGDNPCVFMFKCNNKDEWVGHESI